MPNSRSLNTRLLITVALVLGLVFAISHIDLSPVNAQELQLSEVSVGSASGKQVAKSRRESPLNNLAPKQTESSSKSNSPFRFACDPRTHGISQYEGGTVAYCTKNDFAIADSDSALIEIRSGAARAPHWHDTWEQQIVISGEAKTYLIDEKGQVHEEVLTQGMVAWLPAGMTHWTETIGNQPAVLLLSFPAGFKTFELDDSLIQVGENDDSCASKRAVYCIAKPKSLILILKNGLL